MLDLLLSQIPTVMALIGGLLRLERRLTRLEIQIELLTAPQPRRDKTEDAHAYPQSH